MTKSIMDPLEIRKNQIEQINAMISNGSIILLVIMYVEPAEKYHTKRGSFSDPPIIQISHLSQTSL